MTGACLTTCICSIYHYLECCVCVCLCVLQIFPWVGLLLLVVVFTFAVIGMQVNVYTVYTYNTLWLTAYSIIYLKVTIIYGDNILRIGGIAHFARIKFYAYAACARAQVV